MAVLVDRTGADLWVLGGGRGVVEREAGGADGPLTKSAPGGWSQPRYQRRAENTWERNAGEVAREITDLAQRFEARLIVVAGDERAVQLLQESLPEQVAACLDVVPGGRSEDGSQDGFSARVRARLDAAVAVDTAGVVERLREELGQSDRAVEGPKATLAALARAQVDVLLVHDDGHDGPEGLFGPSANAVGLALDDLAALGVDEPQKAPLVDVAVRAALGTGAALRVVGSNDLASRLGAILRWP